MKADLRLPPDIDRRLRNSFGPVFAHVLPDLGCLVVVPGGLEQQGAEVRIADLRDSTATDLATAGMFARDEPEVGHELPRVRKTPNVADLANETDSYSQGDSPERLERLDLRCQRPTRKEKPDLFVDLLDSGFDLFLRVEVTLKRNLLEWQWK